LQHDSRFASAGARWGNLDALYELIDPKFAAKTTSEWIALLESHDMICAPVADYADLIVDPQALENEYLVTVDHPSNGPPQIVGMPWRFSEMPMQPAAAAPELGQHTDKIMTDAGFSSEEIANLKKAGVVG
jgi:crotonobetainyl-CoA:carnitine CoA-transferase CaiB-like acyl-CoA transferase